MGISESVDVRVARLAEELIDKESSLFLVKVILKGTPGNQKLLVLIDGDNGVTVDDCSGLSRKLADILESEDVISGKYTLEVSSAGVDFPLSSTRQYTKNIGRSLRVDQKDGSMISGQLKEVKEDLILIEVKEKKTTRLLEVNFSEIDKSTVLVSFK